MHTQTRAHMHARTPAHTHTQFLRKDEDFQPICLSYPPQKAFWCQFHDHIININIYMFNLRIQDDRSQP